MKNLKQTKSKTTSAEIARIISFVSRYVRGSGAKGVVVGLSGGIDSAVVAALCAKALGPRRVLGVHLFEEDSRGSIDFKDAISVAKMLGLTTIDIRLTPVIRAFKQALNKQAQRTSRITLGNIKARSRMILLYALANQKNLLVAGTGDRSEELVGFFTKYGDGAADILPIAHLYKTEVRAIGAELRLPYNVVTKPSSPNLWEGHKAVDELPADYYVLDRILMALFDEHKKANQVANLAGVSQEIVIQTIQKKIKSEHKRQLPVSLQR